MWLEAYAVPKATLSALKSRLGFAGGFARCQRTVIPSDSAGSEVVQPNIDLAFWALTATCWLIVPVGLRSSGSSSSGTRTSSDRKSTRLNSSHDQISYAVFCLKKKKKK